MADDDTDAAAPPAAPAAADPSPPSEEEEEEVKNDSEGAAATPSAGGADEDAAAVAAGTTAEDAGADAADAAAVTSAALTAALSSLAVAATASSSAPPVEVEDADGDEDGGDDDDEDDDEDYDPDGDDDAEAYANEFLSLLPPCVLPRVERLKSLNAKRDLMMEEYRLERAALEIKYNERMAPLYVERRDVVNGEYDMAIQEEKWSEDKKNVPPSAPVVEEEGGGEAVKGIPQFWACAMGHVDVIAELITEADVDCLEHLTDITCTDFPDGLGFELNFHFSPNDFFHNSVLTKRYEVPNLLTEDEPILKNVTGADIKWKRDRSLTFREVTKKQRKKGKGAGAGQVRSITKKERTESFFHFFTPMKMPALMDVVDEDEADAVEEAFDHDYDVAQAFRNHVIKKAVLWYTGEAMLEDDYDEEGMMGGEGEDDEEEGGDGDGGGGDDPFPRPAAGDGENPECKQN